MASDQQIKSRIQKRLNLTTLKAVVANGPDGSPNVPGWPGYAWIAFVTASGLSQPVAVRFRSVQSSEVGTPVILGQDDQGNISVISADFDGQLAVGINPFSSNTLADPNVSGDNFVNQSQLTTLLSGPISSSIDSMLVTVQPWIYVQAGTLHWFLGGDGSGEAPVDLTSYIPSSAGMQCVAVLFVDDTDMIEIQASTPIPTADPLSPDDVQECITNASDGAKNKPIVAYHLYHGQTDIKAGFLDTGGDVFLDLRNFINVDSSGGGSGTVTSVGVSTDASYLTVGSSPVTTSGTITLDKTTGLTGNQVVATPDGTTGAADLRALVNGDIPSTLSGKTLTSPVINTGVSGTAISTDGTFATPSDTILASQKATKTYVDAVASGLSPKASVRLATAAALPSNTYSNGSSGVGATITGLATGVLTIDSAAVALNDRLLIKDEVTQANNGIYICTLAGAVGVAFVLTRTTDANTSAEIIGSFVFVEAGTVNASAGFVNTNSSTITIGTTAITFTQFSGAGEINAGTGLSKSGNTLSLQTPVALANGGTGADLSGTGAAHSFVKQSSSGAALSVGTIADADLPTALAGHTITGGSIDNTPIGATTQNTAWVTTLMIGTSPTLSPLIKEASTAFSFRNHADSADAGIIAGGANFSSVLTVDGQYIEIWSTTAPSAPASNIIRFYIESGVPKIIFNGGAVLIFPTTADTLVGRATTDTLTNKTLTTPTIGDFTNATHNHTNAAGGGQLTDAALTSAVGAAKGGTSFTSYTKGDLIVATGSTALAKQGIGTDGQALIADSSLTNGLGYKGVWVTLSANNILGSTAASFDLTSIPAGYSHLKLYLKLRSDKAAVTQENVYLRINNDSTAGDYYSYGINESGTTVAQAATQRLGATGTAVEIKLGCTAATATSGYFAYLEITILDYAVTTTPHQVFWQGAIQLDNSTGDLELLRGHGLWTSTSAISRLTILPVSAGNFVANSSCMLMAAQ